MQKFSITIGAMFVLSFFLVQNTLAYTVVIDAEDMASKIEGFITTQRAVKQLSDLDGTVLPSCSCQVAYSNKNYTLTKNGISFVNDASVKQIGYINLYKNYAGTTILSGSDGNGSSLWKINASVDFSKPEDPKSCDLQPIYTQGENPFPGYFIVNSCSMQVKSCCCKADDAAYSTRYYGCGEVSSTSECSGKVFSDDGQVCKTYEGSVKQKTGVSAPKGDKAEVSLEMGVIKDQAAGLNKLGKDINVNGFIGRVVKGMMAFMGMILFVLYIYAGLLWMLASGNDEQITKSKNILVWSTLGVAVMLGSYVIVQFIFSSLKV